MGAVKYKIKAGDTLPAIALHHHVSVVDLARANNIKDIDGRLQPGRSLIIPAASPLPAPKANLPPRTHVVGMNDRLPDIARRYGLSVEELLRANSDLNPRLLWLGQKLKLPPSQSAVRMEGSTQQSVLNACTPPTQNNPSPPPRGVAPGPGLLITSIPSAMDKLKWTQAARVMRRWFAAKPYVMPREVKLNRVDDRLLDKAHVLDDLPFDWLLSASTRVKPTIDELAEGFAQVDEYSHLIGRVKGALDQLSPGLVQLMWRLEQLGLLDAKRRKLNNGSRFLGALPAIQLEQTSQFNFVTVGTRLLDKAFDDLDDVYGALGAFAIQLAVTQVTTQTSHVGFSAITINELGLYVRDTYEFRNEAGTGDQLLGYWSHKGVYRPGLWNYLRDPPSVEEDGITYSKITNDSFNDYRRLHGRGGDFVIYSTVKYLPVSISIHLNDTDFMEYLDRRPKAR